MSFELKQIITQILAFLIMLWVLNRYAWKPLLAILDERTRKIKAAFIEIAEKNALADLRMSEYQEQIGKIKEEGQRIIQTSVKEARQIAQELQLQTQKKAHEILLKANEEAERELAKARVELKKDIAGLVCKAFEKIIRVKLSQEEKERFGIELMEEM